jgi:hypothetical protein
MSEADKREARADVEALEQAASRASYGQALTSEDVDLMLSAAAELAQLRQITEATVKALPKWMRPGKALLVELPDNADLDTAEALLREALTGARAAEVKQLRAKVAEQAERLRRIWLACEGVRSAAQGARLIPVETSAIRTWLGAQGHQVDPLPDEAPPVLTVDRALDLAADMFERIARGDP